MEHIEAIVQVRRNGTDNWVNSFDLDSLYIPRLDNGLADVYDETVMNLVDSILVADTSPTNLGPDFGVLFRYRVIWADTRDEVSGSCSVCGQAFLIAEGAPADELNEGVRALVFCGCADAD